MGRWQKDHIFRDAILVVANAIWHVLKKILCGKLMDIIKNESPIIIKILNQTLMKYENFVSSQKPQCDAIPRKLLALRV